MLAAPASVLRSEVLAPEPLRLCGGEPRPAKHVDDLVGKLALLGRNAGRNAPAQASSDVVMYPRLRACDLVSTTMQLAHLLEQGLVNVFVDPHQWRTVLDEP